MLVRGSRGRQSQDGCSYCYERGSHWPGSLSGQSTPVLLGRLALDLLRGSHSSGWYIWGGSFSGGVDNGVVGCVGLQPT
jgi:hypothetical protein